MQAVTRVNAEQAPKALTQEPTRRIIGAAYGDSIERYSSAGGVPTGNQRHSIAAGPARVTPATFYRPSRWSLHGVRRARPGSVDRESMVTLQGRS